MNPASALPARFHEYGVISVTPQLKFFDISWVDTEHHTYVLGDTDAKALLIASTTSDRQARLVTGFAGPAGVLINPSRNLAWVADSDSTVKLVDLRSGSIIATVSTGGTKRADELALDPKDHVVIAANDLDSPPFLTFISATSDPDVLGHVRMPVGTSGLEQPVWDPASDVFYVTVPKTPAAPGGQIVELDPISRSITHHNSLSNCNPSGEVLGRHGQLFVACESSAEIIRTNGTVVATAPEAGGADEVAYDAATNEYFAARLTGGLFVVDATNGRVVQTIATPPLSHSVAVDAAKNRVLVPEIGVGIVVFQPPG